MRFFALVQSFLFLVSSFSVTDSNFKMWVDRAAVNVASEKELKFNSIPAQELGVKDSEKQRCRHRQRFQQQAQYLQQDTEDGLF